MNVFRMCVSNVTQFTNIYRSNTHRNSTHIHVPVKDTLHYREKLYLVIFLLAYKSILTIKSLGIFVSRICELQQNNLFPYKAQSKF